MSSELQRLYQQQHQPGESERTRKMALLESYLTGEQYAGLPRAWDETIDEAGHSVPFRLRRPSTIVPLPSLIVDTFVRSLWAAGRRPLALTDDEAETDELVETIDESRLHRVMREATRRALTVGTGVVVWKRLDGRIHAEAWDAKWCTPTFTPGCFPCLERLEIKFPFTVEENGKAITKWHREVIDAETWRVYQDAEVTADREPVWNLDSSLSVEHGLGSVPATWFVIDERTGPWDGTGIYSSLLGLFDDMNITASQQARALHYNLDPQVVMIGVDEVDLDALKRGGGNVWPLRMGSTATLLESNGSYVTSADKRLDALRRWVLDAAAVVINDPEKIAGAQSGSALELLSAPMLARVSELREDIGDAYRTLLEQMLSAKRPGTAPRVRLHWGMASPATTQDAQQAVTAAVAAVNAGIVSRAAAARYVAPYVGITDPDSDQESVENLESALALDASDMPSPTFQVIRKTALAKKHLGELASPADHAAIARELAKAITPEGMSDDHKIDEELAHEPATNGAEA